MRVLMSLWMLSATPGYCGRERERQQTAEIKGGRIHYREREEDETVTERQPEKESQSG